MRSILSERNVVVVLFVMVLITFSLAQEDTKKMEQIYQGTNQVTVSLPGELKNEQAATKPENDKNVVLPSTYHQ